MEKKYKKNLKDINYYNHIEKLILKDDYLKHYNIDKTKEEEVEIILEEKRLKWLNEKIYKLKENLIYNNLSSDYLHELNLSNLTYYKTYFETFKNFDSEDYSNLVLLRMNFLDHIIEESKEKEKELNAVKIAHEITEDEKFSGEFLSKKSILKNETDQYSIDEEKQRIFNQIFSTISSLFSVILLYDTKVCERSKTKEEIILCLFNNLNMQSEKVYFHSIYAMKEIEKNLFLLINIFQQNLLSGSDLDIKKNNKELSEFNEDDYLNFISEILEKLLSVTARLNSFTSFLKILYVLKENKIALKNHNYLIENILNPKVRSLIKPIDEKYFIEEKKIILNDYFCNSEVLQTEILVDEKFIFFQSLVLRDKSDLYINIFNIDKELKGNKIDQNKILDFKSYSIRDYLFETVKIKIAENIKKDINDNDAEYTEYLSNLKKVVNSEIRIKSILPHNNDHLYILFNQLNTESYKILKIRKDNFSLTSETNIDSMNTYETLNIFTTRDCFYFLKRQIDDDNKFDSEKLDIFDSGSKEKNYVFEFERLDFSFNKNIKSDLKTNNIFSDFEKTTIILDYSKLNFNEKEKINNINQRKNHKLIKDFVDFCKEDVNNKFYNLYYLNNKLIFFNKSSKIKKFLKIDINCFFNENALNRDPIKFYDSIVYNQFFTEMEMIKEKELENVSNLFYDINSNFIYGLSLVEKLPNKENNMELFKYDELVIKYRIYYNPYSFPAEDDSIHNVLNNNRINENKKLLDSLLQLDENPRGVNKFGLDFNENLKQINFDLIKTNSSDFMNIDGSKEIIKAKLESFANTENINDLGNKESNNELESKRMIKDYNNYKNLSNLFIKNSDDDLENAYSNNPDKSRKRNLKFLKGNELASELYFEIAFRSLAKYIINNSNIITTLKNVKKINKEVYSNFFKISYPKFVYHFGKNMSSELFNIFWNKNFMKLNKNLEIQISFHKPSMFSSEIDGELILLDMILLENLLNNFKHLKMGYFENYFDIENLKQFSSLLIKILTFKLNENYEVKNILSSKNSLGKLDYLENEILNQTTKILVLIINNVKNHSYIFNIKNFDDLAKLLVNKIHKQKIDFCDENSYLFYFLSLFLNTSEITLDKKYEMIDFILKSEITFIKNLNKCFNENLNVDLHIKNKYFEKTFNNVIYFLIKDFTDEENLKNLNNKDSKQIKILNTLNENLIDLINELKRMNKNLLDNKSFKLYIKNFSLILNSNFIIFNLIFRLYNYEYANLTNFMNARSNKKNQAAEIVVTKEDLMNHKYLSNKEYYKLIKDERKEIPFLIIEKTLLLLFYLNELDTILLDINGKTGVIYDLISDKIYTCDSEHPQNIKNKNFYTFEFADKNNKYIKFDYCSRIFNKSKIELNAKYDVEFENKILKEKFESPKPKGIPYTQSYANLTSFGNTTNTNNLNNIINHNLENETSILIENNEEENYEDELENFRIDNNLNEDNQEVKQIIESKSKIDLEINSGYLNSDSININNSKNLKTLNFKYELDPKFEEYINSDPARINFVEETYKFYGYKFKLFNFEDPNMIDDYLIKNLKRLLIFLVCKIFDLILVSPEIYDYINNPNEMLNNINFNANTAASKNPGTNFKLEEKFYYEIFTSRLLNNASLINNKFFNEEYNEVKKELNSNENEEFNNSFIFNNLNYVFNLIKNLKDNLSTKGIDLEKVLKENYSKENGESQIGINFFCDLKENIISSNKSFSQERTNLNKKKEVEIIKNMMNINKEAYDIGIKTIHKNFILKNPWGRIGGKQIDKIIYYIFITVLKYNNLVLKYCKFIEKIENILSDEKNKNLISINEEGEKQIQQSLNSQIINIDNYHLFIKIYTECSKMRSWLNEKKIYYTDIESKKENTPAQKKSSEKIIDIISRKSNELNKSDSKIDEVLDRELIEEDKFEIYSNTLINHKLCFLLEIQNESNSYLLDKEDNDTQYNNYNDSNKLEIIQFNKDILEVIENVFTFIKSENIKTDILIKKINYQNARALNKEAFLILFNFMISILNNQNEIQDLLYWINLKFKESEFIIDFNKDLYGSDPKLSKRVYNEFYNFIYLLIRKLKRNENNSNNHDLIFKSNLTSVGLINIFQSLIWNIRKSDFEFYKTHGFFEIFSSKGIVSNILNLTVDSDKGIPNLKNFESRLNSIITENIETYGKDCFDIKFLQNFIFDSFSIFSLQILNKFHSRNYNDEEEAMIKSFKEIDEDKLNATDRNALLQKQSSVLHSNEFLVIDIISDILFNEFKKYIDNWRSFINNKMNYNKPKGLQESMTPFANEDKLNSYLILLFRCLSFNSHLIDHFTISHPNLFPIILEIFLYANEKNKILIIKFIELFLRFYNEKLLNKCIINFIENTKYIFSDFILVSLQNTFMRKGINLNVGFLQENKFEFKNFYCNEFINNEEHVGFKFLFEFIITLIKAMLNSSITLSKKVKYFKTNADKEIGFEFIHLIRNFLKNYNSESSKLLKEFILEKIRNNFNDNKRNIREENTKIEAENERKISNGSYENLKVNTNDYSDKILLLLILGVDFCPLRVGQKVAFEQVFREKDYHAYDIYEYSYVSAKNSTKIFDQTDNNKKKDDLTSVNLDSETDNLRLGVIVGFTNSSNNPFVIDASMNEFSYENLSYSPDKKYAVVVVEDSLNKQNMKNLNFETVIIDIEKLIIKKENPVDNIMLLSIIKESGLSNWILNYLIDEIKNEKNEKFRYICLNLFTNMIMAKEETIYTIEDPQNRENQNLYNPSLNLTNLSLANCKKNFFVNLLENLNENDFKKIIINLEEFSNFSLKNRIRSSTLEKLEHDNIFELISESEKNLEDDTPISNNMKKLSINNRKNSINDRFSFLGSFNKNTNSFCVKFCGNFIKEFEVDFVYNFHRVIANDEKNIFHHIISIQDYVSLDLTKDEKSKYMILANSQDIYDILLSNEKNKNNKNLNSIKFIVTDNSLLDNKEFNKNFDESPEFWGQVPILIINQLDFMKVSSFIFEGVMDEEFSYLLGCPMDFSSFIEIPSYLVDESVQYGQRDLILKILNETQSQEKRVKLEKNVYQDDVNMKLTSLLSRRIMLILLAYTPKAKNCVNVSNLIKIFKLTVLENNIGKIISKRNWFYPKNDSEEGLIKSAIEYNLRISPTYLIKNFLYNLTNHYEVDRKISEQFLHLDIFEKNNFIEEYLIVNIKTEEELMKFEIFENNVKIIFAILDNEKLNWFEGDSSDVFRDFHLKFIQVLALNNQETTLKNPKMGEFAIDAINTIFNQIIFLLESGQNFSSDEIKDSTINNNINKNEKALQSLLKSLQNYKFIFSSNEFNKFFEKVFECVKINKNSDVENTREVQNIDLKIINLLISVYDMIFILFLRYNIDLNIDNFLKNKFLEIYFSYSLLNCKLEKLEILVLFKLKNELIIKEECKKDYKKELEKFSNKIEFSHFFKEKDSSIAHLMKYEFPDSEDVNLKVSYIDQSVMDPEHIFMIYSKFNLKNINNESDKISKFEFQDLINTFDIKKNILIKNKEKNSFYVSLPHGNFKTNLFNFGNNDKNSLGCGYNDFNIHDRPAPAIGILSKLIRSFKYGYYHSFAVTTDNKVYVCGRETGSGTKDLRSNTPINNYSLDNYFNEIAQENQVDNIWANNYNTSIMLTKNNQLYGCGKNTDGILCNLCEIGEFADVEKPGRLPDIPNEEKIKLLACGYKSVMYLTENHNLYAIGCNTFYECGNRTNNDRITQYHKLTLPSNIKITNVVSGENYFLFLGKDEYNKSRLYSIGCNNQGQCGMDGDNSGKFNLCRGVENSEFKVIASRNSSSAAISKKGELYTFGVNDKGNLSQPNQRTVTVPSLVKFFENYIVDDVSLSHFHMLVVCRHKENGIKKIFSCGSNEYGCLGISRSDGSLINQTPVEITYFGAQDNEDPMNNIIPVKVATSRYQSFVMGLMTNFEKDRSLFGKNCKACSNPINNRGLFFQNFPIFKNEKIVDEKNINQNNKTEDLNEIQIEINNEKDEKSSKDVIESDSIKGIYKKIDFICEDCCLKVNNIQIEKTIEENNRIISVNNIQKLENEIDLDKVNINEENEKLKYLNCLQSDVSDLMYYSTTPFTKNIQEINISNLIQTRSEFENSVVENFYKENQNHDIMDVVFVNFDKDRVDSDNKRQDYEKKLSEDYILNCVNCKTKLNENYNQIFISTENQELILCKFCSLDNPNCLTYPQVFYCFNRYRVHKDYIKYLPIINFSELLYGVKKSEKPYLILKIESKVSELNKLNIFKRLETKENLFSTAKKLNEDIILEFNELTDKKEVKITNGFTTTSDLFDYIRSQENAEGEFTKLTKLSKDDFKILDKLSFSLNQSIVLLSSIISNSNQNNFIQKVITKNLNLIQPSKRLGILWEKIDRIRLSVNPNDYPITLNRMKAVKFYEKGVPDTSGENTLFKQLFSKMKKFPVKNYLCKKSERLFRVYFKGEGAADMGGPYRDLFSNISEELQSDYLDLFIRTPNNKNEIGNFRDKFIPNPSSKSTIHQECYYFIGCLIASAIASGQLLSLNLHPLVWKMMLNRKVNFNEYDSVDKHFCKIMSDLEKCDVDKIITEDVFEDTFDLNFTILLSDKTEVELIPNGKKTKVTLDNKNKYIVLAKAERLREFKFQVESMRYGLINVIPETALSLINEKDLEELSCGVATIDIDILKQNTQYDGYDPNSQTIQNFWRVLKEFTNDEKVAYIKYVWGRTRLPDPNLFPFVHLISKAYGNNPDTHLPTSATCFFQLKLPNYSTYLTMFNKLKYAIKNCSEIDADFNVNEND